MAGALTEPRLAYGSYLLSQGDAPPAIGSDNSTFMISSRKVGDQLLGASAVHDPAGPIRAAVAFFLNWGLEALTPQQRLIKKQQVRKSRRS